MGNIISFARGSYTHNIPDMFMRATVVAILLSPGLDWNANEAMPRHRQQIRELLRDLSSFLRQCNEDGTTYERSASKLVYGLSTLAEKDPTLVEAALPGVLLEGAELGLLDLTQEERLVLERMRTACSAPHNGVPTLHPPGLQRERASNGTAVEG